MYLKYEVCEEICSSELNALRSLRVAVILRHFRFFNAYSVAFSSYGGDVNKINVACVFYAVYLNSVKRVTLFKQRNNEFQPFSSYVHAGLSGPEERRRVFEQHQGVPQRLRCITPSGGEYSSTACSWLIYAYSFLSLSLVVSVYGLVVFEADWVKQPGAQREAGNHIGLIL